MKKTIFTSLSLFAFLLALTGSLLNSSFLLAEEPTKQETYHENSIQDNDIREKKKEPTATPPYFQDDEDEKEAQVEQPHFSELLSRMLIMLVVTVGGFALFAWFAKKFLHNRMQGLNRQGRIQIIEQRALSQKSALYIIKIDGKEFLITESASGMGIKDL